MNQYLIRLDDACPTMDAKKWMRMEDILDRYGIRPMVGIIPNNKDCEMEVDPPDFTFWDKVSSWQQKGWEMALHGYDHCYTSSDGLKGLNPLWKRSEFAGFTLEVQREKIRMGLEVFRKHNVSPRFFFAPSHTFDETTLQALELESDIRYISDTIARKPYKLGNFVIVPQFGGRCSEMKITGVWTFCFHPNVMDDKSFKALETFLETHKNEFIAFDQIDYDNVTKKDLLSRLVSWAYFVRRNFRGIK